MIKKLGITVSLTLLTACSTLQRSETVSPAEIVDTYIAIAQASYEDY